jgi:hypothetical protein
MFIVFYHVYPLVIERSYGKSPLGKSSFFIIELNEPWLPVQWNRSPEGKPSFFRVKPYETTSFHG